MDQINPVFVLSVIYCFVVIAFSLHLIKNRKMKKTSMFSVLALTVILAGFLPSVASQLIRPGAPSWGYNVWPDPVSSLMDVLNMPYTGIFLPLPTMVLAGILISSLIVGRGFCGYACPAGALQEVLSRLSPKQIRLKSKATNVVRFVSLMVVIGLVVGVIPSPIWWLYHAFGIFSLSFYFIPTVILIILLIGSLLVYRPWCRLLCPFGALASLASRFSYLKLNRKEGCIKGCLLCEKACPTQEAYRTGTKSECYLCNRCIEACPKDALSLSHQP